ncbi:MAG: ATP-binding cassette domain-containing protein, partial [Halioglobus sp.]|nr:ATP-binding cassette domain-containing protein [Halioglobus sp.]
MSAIEISALKKSFGTGNPVLKSIDTSVDVGEMVALIGPSGSGKSTLLRHLSGLCVADRDSQSHITVNGRAVQSQGKLAADIRQTRAHIGCIFQQFNLVNRLSVLTNVVIGGLSRMPLYRS